MTSVRLAWSLATRYYSTGIDNPYVRFINRASRIGFALGVAALIIGLSLMNGFERELRNSMLSVIPDIEFEAVSGALSNWPITAKQVQGHPDVVAVAPYIKTNAMIQRQNEMEAVLLKGVSHQLESQVNAIPNSMLEGQWLKETNPNHAVIGVGLANKLNLSLGDSIELLIPKYSDSGKLLAPAYLPLTIGGIYKVGGQMDQGQVFTHLATLQNSQGLTTEQALGVNVKLKDPFQANRIANQLGAEITDYVYVLDWYRSQGHIYNDIILVRDIMYLVMILVMSVASFNIVSSLSMSVQEKYSDIGILMTLGLKAQSIKLTFLFMGLLTALRGIGWGVFWGSIISVFLTDIMTSLESLFGFKALDSDVYFIDHLPTEIAADQVIIVAATAFVIALLASLYPAKKAARLSPIELLN